MKKFIYFLLAGFITNGVVLAQNANYQPAVLRDVKIVQKLNSQIPLELTFKDETGQTVRLQDYFGSKPVVLSLVYYECPNLCNMILNGVVRALRAISFDVGKEFNVLTISFDPDEGPQLAATKKQNYIKKYNRKGAEKGWHFLTGDQKAIAALTDAVGFQYKYIPSSDQFAHASGIMVLTPAGKVARYFYGVEYSPRDLKFSLMEASKEKIGSPVDQVLLYCFSYDPTTGKYGLVIMRVLRLAGIATVLILGSFMLVMLRREKKGKLHDQS
ncbi:MAG: SCO family protein [Calditrichaeota bacterium]|nr:MAG: SCO family protein [Calditrichota bacterium]